MKKIILLIPIIFCIVLSARENPFEKYEEETGKMYELNEAPKTIEDIQEAQYIKKIQEQMNTQNEAATTLVKEPSSPVKAPEKTYSKKELETIIQKTNKQNEQKTKEIVKKELANVKKEPEQVIYVKPRADIDSEKPQSSTNNSASKVKTILPFLKIENSDNELIIRSEHKMFKKFSIDKENKLAFDYKAKVSFNTKKELLVGTFKNIAVGNHQSGGYYRVAVELASKPAKYSVDVSEGVITIKLK